MAKEKQDLGELKRIRGSKLASLTRLYKDLEKNMLSYENSENVTTLFEKLCDRYEQFKSVHLECLDVCTDSSVIEQLEVSFESCLKNFEEFRERISQWMAEKKAREEKIPDEASSTVSRVTSRSTLSSRSSVSQLKSAKAKRLVAEHKLKKLKEKQELEKARNQIDMKQQLLEQESEIEEAKIEESVWIEVAAEEGLLDNSEPREVLENNTVNYRVQNRKMNNQEEVINNNSVPVNFIEERRSDVGVSSIETAFQRIASSLHDGFNLPKPELFTFNGNPIDYCKFIKNFETNIESRVSDNQQRLSYLIQYCVGEAKSSIEDCVLLDSYEGYKRAKSILYSRYGRPHVIARTYIDKLVFGAQIKASDVDELSKLSLEMQKCEMTLTKLGFSSDIDNSENLRRIVKRLPMHMRVKWVEIAHSINESGREPRFSDLTKFVDEKSRIASSMYGYDLCKDKCDKGVTNSINGKNAKKNVKVVTLSTQSENKTEKVEKKHTCICCSGTCFDLVSCSKFISMSLNDRYKLVRRFKYCYNCLKGKHFSHECRKPSQCTVSECTKKHNLLLHSWVKPDHTATGPSVHCAETKGASVKNCLGIIPVNVMGGNGNSCRTYALLDDGADKTLCDERLLNALKIPSKPVTFKLSTVSSADGVIHGKEVDLHVSSANGENDINLRKVWSVKTLPISTRSAVRNQDIQNLPYLSDIQIPDVESKEVMLLIGTDSPLAHIPLEVRSGTGSQPYAVRSRLGWAIRGPIQDVSGTEEANVHFGESGDDILQQQLERMWKTDFNDRVQDDKVCMSIEDKKALKIMDSTLEFQDGHYTLGLPWRNNNSSLPNNITLAQARLYQLKRKLLHDEKLHEMYTKTVTEYIDKGYARELNNTDVDSNTVWYLPHHPVTNENKPGKVRVVFDCAAKYQGVSLNSQLLQGPDLMNNLIGVVIRFRQERIAIAADIEAMFHQVRVKKEDCDALRFLWWPNGQLDQEPKHYCMQVHLFGATSSPSCTAYALKQTAKDNGHLFEPEVVKTVQNNFYVDDCLKSVSSEDGAIQLAKDLQSMMKMGGFRLTKWISNSRAVLETIPEAERAPSVVDLNPDDNLPSEKALGIIWDINDDMIKFRVKISDKPLTRRGILSVLSSIFDPIGLLSPVMLKAKIIIQNLCRAKLAWDDTIPQIYSDQWHNWLRSLPCLENLTVNRCFKPNWFHNAKYTELHLFSDGSEVGYGACAYLRLVDEFDNITCSLVMGKSRLSPIKQMSIPRLELSGAVIACRLYEFISEELEFKIDRVTFWTDSTIVLGYIRNTSRRFKTFVANRLSIIQRTTSPDQWCHVDSKSNPADIASRGIDASDSGKLHVWLNGPEFLWQNTIHSQSVLPDEITDVADDDDEIKREIEVHAITSTDPIGNLMNYYSDWTKLQRATAWILRFKDYCRYRYLRHDVKLYDGDLKIPEIRRATETILVNVQKTSFPEEMKHLSKMTSLRNDSRIISLNPILHNGLIRVRGRVNSKEPKQCPIILPYNHHITTLIIRFYHETQGHVGRQQVLAAARDKYWIMKGPSYVKHVLKGCGQCKRQNKQFCSQQMAPLLDEQIDAEKPPFTYIGIDYFGPLMVKSGRSHLKRYGCLFTCLTSRAVHLEIAHSLTTDSFIAAFQRFVSRRGVPQKVFSDNGTNLVGGEKDLRKSIHEWNQLKINKFMLQEEIEWHFNPPSASHMGGAWERMIRSTRKILKALVKEQLLTDEQLSTLMTEVEKILNDRPITTVSNDPNDPAALTPNTLLLMKSNHCIPHGIFNKKDIYARRWWRQVQYLSNVFWRRWIREYLPMLQLRQKWQRPNANIQKDDVVLVAQENIPRGQWPLGRVIRPNCGRDGLVRSCVVRFRGIESIRPITKLCLLECSD